MNLTQSVIISLSGLITILFLVDLKQALESSKQSYQIELIEIRDIILFLMQDL